MISSRPDFLCQRRRGISDKALAGRRVYLRNRREVEIDGAGHRRCFSAPQAAVQELLCFFPE